MIISYIPCPKLLWSEKHWFCVEKQSYEEVRKKLEMCDIITDINWFIRMKATGTKPPGELYYSFTESTPHLNSRAKRMQIYSLQQLLSVFQSASPCSVTEPVLFESCHGSERSMNDNQQTPSAERDDLTRFGFIHRNHWVWRSAFVW